MFYYYCIFSVLVFAIYCLSDIHVSLTSIFHESGFLAWRLEKMSKTSLTELQIKTTEDIMTSTRDKDITNAIEKVDDSEAILESEQDMKENEDKNETNTSGGTTSTTEESDEDSTRDPHALMLLETQQTFDNFEQYARRKSVRIYGIPEQTKTPEETEDTLKVVMAFLRYEMQIRMRPELFESCVRIDHIADEFPSSNHRPILVKFTHIEDQVRVLRSRHILKWTAYRVVPDITTTRFNLLKEAKQGFSDKTQVWCDLKCRIWRKPVVREEQKPVELLPTSFVDTDL